MSKVIVYTNSNGNVSVCMPTNELPIEQVLTKDCPLGAIIIDNSELPQGDDVKYLNAWELIDGKVVVNQVKKTAIQLQKEEAESTKISALSKLSALGLTQDELTSLLG